MADYWICQEKTFFIEKTVFIINKGGRLFYKNLPPPVLLTLTDTT